MMTDEEILALPKKAANRREVDGYYYMDAYCDKLSEIEQDMEKRCKLVPGAWRELRLIRALTEKWLRVIGGTFEEQKAQQMKRMGRNLHVELKFNLARPARDKDLMLVEMEELGTLIVAANQECKLRMCAPGDCHRCQLGKVFDALSWVSRGNRAWWEVFEEKAREGTGNENHEN